METLSVVIITRNEEKNIAHCIDSVNGLADEVLVMDSYSSDKTPLIAREKGAILHQQAFAGYGAQKNSAADLCSSTYILFLDADEYPGKQLFEAILEEKKQGFPAHAYAMNRLNRYCGQWIRHGSWYPDTKIRIIRRGRGSWNQDLVHESLVPEAGVTVKHLKGDLLHEAYGSVEEQVRKNNHYSTLSAQLLFQRGKKTNLFKMLVNPFWAFCSGYIFKLGFMDGINGLIVASNIAHLSFLKHVKLYRLQHSEISARPDGSKRG